MFSFSSENSVLYIWLSNDGIKKKKIIFKLLKMKPLFGKQREFTIKIKTC